MKLSGQSLIQLTWRNESQCSESTDRFYAFSPIENAPIEPTFYESPLPDVDIAAEAAASAFVSLRQSTRAQRAVLLTAIADEIIALGDVLIQRAHQETGLPIARLEGERGRTVNQLNAFVQALLVPENSVEDCADPQRTPLPKPHTRLTHIPLGPVAVFGASNFPLAFSVAGGDTASALAAGCPVIVKAHPAHPGTSELVARAIVAAIKTAQCHPGTFALLQGQSPALSEALVAHPHIKAVGFTGSQRVGLILQRVAQSRPEPIPFYGELGSINPQVILRDKATQESTLLAEQLVASMMMGHGQFCTSPGLWLYPEESAASIEQAASAALTKQRSDVMLTPGIVKSFTSSIHRLLEHSSVEVLSQGEKRNDAVHMAQPTLLKTSVDALLTERELHDEIFGPCALLVAYSSETALLALIKHLEGQLTASIHGTEQDWTNAGRLVDVLSQKVGRLIFNQMPTGVEVCASMNHGGPFPASTDVRTTSVGLAAMQRFLRPVCYQNMPASLYPSA